MRATTRPEGIHDHVPRVSRQGRGRTRRHRFRDDDGPPSLRAPTPGVRPRLHVGMIVRVATVRAARELRVVVGVGHGSSMWDEAGRASPIRCRGRGRRESARYVLTATSAMLHPAPTSYAVDHAGGVLCWDWVPGSHCDGQRILERQAEPRDCRHKPIGL